jgi:hypothetical protein
MNRRRIAAGVRILCGCAWMTAWVAWPAAGQIAQMPEKMDPGEHEHAHHHVHIPMGEEKCEARDSYEEGASGPGHWPGVCATGKMQAPIDIEHSQKLPVDIPKFNYQPAPLHIINDCNQYRESTSYVRMRRPTFLQNTPVWWHLCNYCATKTYRGLRS